MHGKFGLLCLILTNLAASVQANQVYPISQFVQTPGKEPLALIQAGYNQGMLDGSVFDVYRKLVGRPGDRETPVWIKTGSLKATEVKENFALAKIVANSTEHSKMFFPKFPGVMAGDLIVAKRIALAPRQILSPEVELTYFDIFIDPKQNPRSFELSSEGKSKIADAAKRFAKARLPLLIVEGHTDGNGSAEANQIEAYQRAYTVRQFLISQLDFDPDKVVAIGYGESELKEEGYAPGYRRRNRRIVFKSVE